MLSCLTRPRWRLLTPSPRPRSLCRPWPSRLLTLRLLCRQVSDCLSLRLRNDLPGETSRETSGSCLAARRLLRVPQTCCQPTPRGSGLRLRVTGSSWSWCATLAASRVLRSARPLSSPDMGKWATYSRRGSGGPAAPGPPPEPTLLATFHSPSNTEQAAAVSFGRTFLAGRFVAAADWDVTRIDLFLRRLGTSDGPVRCR